MSIEKSVSQHQDELGIEMNVLQLDPPPQLPNQLQPAGQDQMCLEEYEIEIVCNIPTIEEI